VTSLMFISLGSIIGSEWWLGALLAAQIAGPASLPSWILGGAVVVVRPEAASDGGGPAGR
jgi:L-asparagine transporter-like permease